MTVWGTPAAKHKPVTRPHDLDVLRAVKRGRNGSATTLFIASLLGYRPARAGRLAVYNRLESMRKAGLVCTFASDSSQWAVRYWCLDKAGSKLLEGNGAPE